MLHILSRHFVYLMMASCAGCGSDPDPPVEPDAGPDVMDAAVETGGFTGMMECGDLPVASPDCASCSDLACCDQGTACGDEAACSSLRACFADCVADDRSCLDGCRSAHAGGVPTDSVLSACRMRNCGAECYENEEVGCGFFMAPEDCNACAQTECCEIGFQANQQASFWEHSACVATCSDDACLRACAADHPEGSRHSYALSGCLGTHCAAYCEIDPPAVCGAFLSSSCAPCVESNCCDASLACHTDVDCLAIRKCAEACGMDDQACVDACRSSFPLGADLHSALGTCLTSSCDAVCP